MTKREFFEMVVKGQMNGTEITDEMVEFAKAEIEKMDNRNEKRRNSVSKKAEANAPIKEAIVNFLKGCEEPMVARAICEEVGHSVQKVSALCRQLVESEVLNSEEVKVKGKGKQKAYSVR